MREDLPGMLVVLDSAARILCAQLVPSPHRRDFANARLVATALAELADATKGRRGLAPVSRVLPLTNPGRESPIESISAGHLHLSGLPMPLFQAPVRTPSGVFYPDCLWANHRLIGEVDGATKYTDTASILLEKEREQALRDLGFGIVRWLGKEIVFQPQLVIDRIARALRE